jgi:hypothetical protein
MLNRNGRNEAPLTAHHRRQGVRKTLLAAEKSDSTMLGALIGLELRLLDAWGRERLIAALLERRDGLALDFTREGLEELSTERLRILVLAAKLLSLLKRQKRCPAGSEEKRPDAIGS